MDNSTKADSIDEHLNLARQELARLASTEEQQNEVNALKQTILNRLPAQRSSPDEAGVLTGLQAWLFNRWWRPALVACFPALIGFAVGIWAPPESEDGNLGVFADLLLAQEESFDWGAGSDE